MPLPSKLLSLEEAQERALLKSPRQKYIDVGGGPLALPQDYHTVVDLPKGYIVGSLYLPDNLDYEWINLRLKNCTIEIFLTNQ